MDNTLLLQILASRSSRPLGKIILVLAELAADAAGAAQAAASTPVGCAEEVAQHAAHA